MGTFSLWHWVIVILVIALLFGSGRVSSLMGDVAKGIKSFKRGISDDDDDLPATGAGSARPQGRITDERPVDRRPVDHGRVDHGTVDQRPATQPSDLDRR